MIWTGTACGHGLDLLKPDPADISLRQHIAPALARINRFNGSIAWSVADHCLAGAAAMATEGRGARLQLLFLLHDAHEAYIGDLPRPTASALSALAETALRVIGAPDARAALGKPLIATIVDGLRANLDLAIYAALGVAAPTAAEIAIVKDMDDRMCGAEMRQLMPPQQKPRAPGGPWDMRPVPTKGALKPGKPEAVACRYAETTERLIALSTRCAA